MKLIGMMPLLSIVVLSGCAQSHSLIRDNSASVRRDVFEETAKRGGAPTGFTDLRVSSTLKTHSAGSFSPADKHGTPEYRLLVNLDGQALYLVGDLQKENGAAAHPAEPEAGDGTRYRFSANLRLKPGSHRLVVALPEEGIAVEKEVTLQEGEFNSIELKPVYARRHDSSRNQKVRSYQEGIRTLSVAVNGKDI